MGPTDCQKQLERISAQILAIEAKKCQGIPFSETSRLEYYEYLQENLIRVCKGSINMKLINPYQVSLPSVQKGPEHGQRAV